VNHEDRRGRTLRTRQLYAEVPRSAGDVKRGKELETKKRPPEAQGDFTRAGKSSVTEKKKKPPKPGVTTEEKRSNAQKTHASKVGGGGGEGKKQGLGNNSGVNAKKLGRHGTQGGEEERLSHVGGRENGGDGSGIVSKTAKKH